MKKLMSLLFVVALVVSASVVNVCAQCTQPHYGKVVNLSDVTMPDGGNDMNVGVMLEGRVTRVQVLKNGNFAVEETGRDAFWVRYKVLAYCNGSSWTPVHDTQLTLKRSEKQLEPIRLPPTRVVKPGESFRTIEKETGVPQDTLRKWNGLDGKGGRKYVIPGEHIFVQKPDVVTRRWEFLGGDPAKTPLREQIKTFRVPDQVKAEWVSLIEASQPDSVWMYSTEEKPLIVDGLCFGKGVSWGRTACFWKNPKTKQNIDLTIALEYPAVDFDGYRYHLYRFVICGNAAYVRRAFVDEAETQVTESQPEPPRSTTRTEIPFYAQPKTPETSHEFVQGGVWWLDYRYAQGGTDRKGNTDRQHSYLGGIEWLPRVSGYDGWKTPLGTFQDLSGVVRIEQALMDSRNHVSGDYRLGARFWVLGDALGTWRTAYEMGAWYRSSQRPYVDYTPISVTTTKAEEKAAYFDGYGGYGRILGLTPLMGYYEVSYKRGKNLDRELGGSYQVEPGHFYLRASYNTSYWRSQSRHFDGQTLSFPADTMKVFEGRIGVKFWHYVVLYASYDAWSYNNPDWSFDWNGPGIGVEWRINRWWRLKGHFKYLNDATDRDLVNDKVYHTDRQWAGIGLDHSW